jgi:hypothetical protein
MTRGIRDNTARELALRLRVEERLTLRQIEQRTGIARSSLSAWLRSHPLTAAERKERRKFIRPGRKPIPRIPGKFAELAGAKMSTVRKGAIAEAAVWLRLELHGYDSYRASGDGGKVDYVVTTPTGLKKVQVRWARIAKHGAPFVAVECSDGRGRRRRYRDDEFDFMVGYDAFSDTAYVFSREEIRRCRFVVSMNVGAAERWDKLGA